MVNMEKSFRFFNLQIFHNLNKLKSKEREVYKKQKKKRIGRKYTKYTKYCGFQPYFKKSTLPLQLSPLSISAKVTATNHRVSVRFSKNSLANAFLNRPSLTPVHKPLKSNTIGITGE